MQVMPWILDVGYTVMCVALMLAVMGHILFGDFEVTMVTLPDSISGKWHPLRPSCLNAHLLHSIISLPVTEDHTLIAKFQRMFEAVRIRCSRFTGTIRQLLLSAACSVTSILPDWAVTAGGQL